MIGGAWRGTRYSIGANLANSMQAPWIAGKERQVYKIGGLAKQIGGGKYQSVAPCIKRLTRTNFKRVKVLPLGHSDLMLGYLSRPYVEEVKLPACRIFGRGFGMTVTDAKKFVTFAQARGPRRFRLGESYQSFGKYSHVARPVFRSDAPVRLSVAKQFLIRRVLPSAPQTRDAGSAMAVNITPSVAPIRSLGIKNPSFAEKNSFSLTQTAKPQFGKVVRGPQGDDVTKSHMAEHRDEASSRINDREAQRQQSFQPGRLIVDFFEQQVRLPPSGIGGFDPRLSPAWAGLQIPG